MQSSYQILKSIISMVVASGFCLTNSMIVSTSSSTHANTHVQRSNAYKNPKIKIRMRQPYFFQKKDGIGPLQKTIGAFCHNPK